MSDPTPRVTDPHAEGATLPPSAPCDPPTLAPQAPFDSAATVAPEPATVSAGTGDARAPAGYAIERELGRGGMGVVYLARSLTLQRPCALKMILSGAHSGDAEVDRFRTEAQAIARLQHPGIVQVFEVGEHDGKPFMALEFCGGGSLDGKLAKNPLPAKEAARLVRSLAEAVHAAHVARVLHRDLKPANVLLTDGGEPKVTDFGLAKKLDEDGATRTGSVMGTPSYMPPEQAEGKKDIGPTADVYALGAILYECLASRPPFRAPTSLDTILQVLTEEPAPVRRLNPQAPVDLETIAHKCLQKEPAKRYPTAQDLADDLGRYLAGEPIRARPVGPVERAAKWVRRNKVVSALAAGVLVALTAGVAVSSYFAYAASKEARAARMAEEHAEGEAKAARKAEADADREAKAARKAEADADREAKLARKAEVAAKEREKAEAEAKTLAQKETERAEGEKTRANEQLRRAEWLVYVGKLSLAQSAFAEGNVEVARQHLEECQWNLRGWEHRHLWTRFNSKQTLKGHTGDVYSAAWSPDGKRILTGSRDGTAKVWDADKGQEVLALKGHTGPVSSVAWSPDGKCILTGSLDRTAKVWDADKGQDVLALMGHTREVTSVAWSPDGKRLFAWDATGKMLAWSAEDGKPVAADDPPARPAPGPARSSDGRLAARPDGSNVAVIDLLRPPPEGSPWPFPDAGQRKAYHAEQAALAEKQNQHFAAAFHLGRLLLDSPDDAGLKQRRDAALKAHAAPAKDK